jgi:hypothetical protein
VKAGCLHDFCSKCSGVFLCPTCKDLEKNSEEKHQQQEVLPVISYQNQSEPVINNEKESLENSGLSLKQEEHQTDLENTQIINQNYSMPNQNHSEEKSNLGVIQISGIEEEEPFLKKPSKKKLNLCSCSYQFALLLLFYIMTLFCCFGWFYNFCFGFSKNNRKRFKSFFCLCLCAPRSLWKKTWKHLVRFKWAN